MTKFFKRGVMAMLAMALLFSNSGKVYADGRDRHEMDSIAMSVLCGNSNGVKKAPAMQQGKMQSALTIKAKGSDFLPLGRAVNDAFYVYALENGAPGYAIISTDDAMPAVLGYSDNGVFDANNMPDAMRDLLGYYAASAPVYAEEEGSEAADEVLPLLGNISFDQGAPYNGMCPMYNNQRTLVGCLATAVAEIAAYHRYPERMKGGTINYTSSSWKIPVSWNCDATVFDWENMRDSYTTLIDDYNEEMQISALDYMIHTGIAPSADYNGYFEIYNFLNIGSSTLNFTAQMILADSEGNYIRPVGNPLQVDGLNKGTYYPVFYLTHGMPADLPDGEYRMYVGMKMKTGKKWNIVKRAVNENDKYNSQRVECYITAQKNGNFYTIDGKKYACGYTAIEGDAVANLSAACGAISKMDYGVSESGAVYIDAAKGLIRYMGYDEDIKYLYPRFFSKNGWIERIKSELHDGYPMLCAGVTKERTGHAFVLDGYRYTNGTPYFHINWGWNGSSDGYFLLSELTPGIAGAGGSVANYGYDLTLVAEIKPNDGVDEGDFVSASSLGINEDVIDVGAKLQIKAKNITNCSPDNITGTLNVYAVSGDKEYLIGRYINYGNWEPLSYYGELSYQLTIPATIPSGGYKIHLYTTSSKGVNARVQIPSVPSVYINNPEMPTSIDEVEKENGDAVIYDISGRVAGDDKQGIYIKEGKKYLSK